VIRIIRNAGDMAHWASEAQARGASLGFVPTMGALHQGHLSLVRKAREENASVAVSIFVNPTQYDDPKDLENYPRTFDEDLKLLQGERVDAVFAPGYDELYPEGYRFRVTEISDSRELEGAFREGHFDGVLSVVLKLFNIVRPRRAYFGQKDFQQYLLVRDMARAFFCGCEVISCPTIREKDGLAMSSRNALLDPEQRRVAPEFFRALSSGSSPGEIRRRLEDAGFDVDYIVRRGGRLLGAVRLGQIRLIDNVSIGTDAPAGG